MSGVESDWGMGLESDSERSDEEAMKVDAEQLGEEEEEIYGDWEALDTDEEEGVKDGEEDQDEVQMEDGDPSQKSHSHRKLKTPKGHEIRAMQDATNLYRSNSFKLQVSVVCHSLSAIAGREKMASAVRTCVDRSPAAQRTTDDGP